MTILSGRFCVSGCIWLVSISPSVFLSALQLKPTGSICRPKAGDCDLAEYCTGLSAACPTDAFTQNGQQCNRGRGYCYNGQCPSRQDHCKRLWGPGEILLTISLFYEFFRLNILTLPLLSAFSWICLDAVVAVDACFFQYGTCRRTLFNQKCSSRYVTKSHIEENVLYNLFFEYLLWFQRSILWKAFLFWRMGLSHNIQEVPLHSRKHNKLQWGNHEPWRQIPLWSGHGTHWYQVWQQYGEIIVFTVKVTKIPVITNLWDLMSL